MIYAFACYFFWGFFPIYWKLLKHVSPEEILAHRVLWAFVFYSLVIYFKSRKLTFFKPPTKKSFIILTLAGSLLMLNWLVYIKAVNSNQIIESSLGYFITPLLNILLGVVILKEKLNRHQVLSVVMAVFGVLIISLEQHRVPWIAFTLGISFSVYGLLKKMNSSKATGLETNQFESMLFAPVAAIFLVYHLITAQPLWTQSPASELTTTIFLLIGGGVITGYPLLLFAEAARRIPYYLMGFFQFLAPTLQFTSGILIFHEPLSQNKLIGFAIIWTGILYLMVTGLLAHQKRKTI